MYLFFSLLFLHLYTLNGFKTWFKPHSIRLTNYPLFDSLPVGNGDEYDQQKDSMSPLKSLLSHSTRWELMYRAIVNYCQQHQQLPPTDDCIISFEGHSDLNLANWVAVQKDRFDGKGNVSALTDDQLNKMMAIDEFREWAIDPLRDNDVRWEFMYRATVDYCQQHHQFPFKNCTISFEGHDDLRLGNWVNIQKQRYNGNGIIRYLSDEQLKKMMAIDEFRMWVEDPLREADVRWNIKFDLLAEYCYFHQKLPGQKYKPIYNMSNEFSQEFNVGSWLLNIKNMYSGNLNILLTEERHDKLMQIPEFRSWAIKRFGTTRFTDFFSVKVKKSGSKKKSTLARKQ